MKLNLVVMGTAKIISQGEKSELKKRRFDWPVKKYALYYLNNKFCTFSKSKLKLFPYFDQNVYFLLGKLGNCYIYH